MNQDTPTQGETVAAPAPSNVPSNPTVPAPQVNGGQADVEAAKRETAQAQIRANQLENELKKMRDDQEAARQKQLEEKEEFKTLYEQTQSRLREIEEGNTAKEREQLLKSETETVFKDYPEGVVELAKMAGLALVDDSDASKASLKEKLDAFKARIGGSSPTITGNNPSNPSNPANATDLVKRDNVWTGSQMAEASARGDLGPQYAYIRELPAIKRMKEIAKGA